MRIDTYVHFSGQCEAAFKFYEEALGGKIEAMAKFAGTPAEKTVTPEWKDKIIHARMMVGDCALLGSDPPPGHYEKPRGFSVCLNVKSTADADRIFNALAEKGEVKMPIQKTFWAERFGMCTDRFGIPWMVNFEKAAQDQASE